MSLAAAGQPGADVALGARRHAEALRVLGRREEAVVARALAVEEAAQERILGLRVRMGEDEADTQALVGGRRPSALGQREAARDVGDEDAVGRGGVRHGGERGEQHERADDLSHPRVDAPEVGNLLGLRAR